MALFFSTGNKHKFEEVKSVLGKEGIIIEQADCDYPEDHSKGVHEIAQSGAKYCAEKLGQPVFVDDTGIFFESCDNYPGAAPKAVFNRDGYDGLLGSLKNKERNAYFITVIGFCIPGEEPLLFDGKMHGRITEKVYDIDKDVLPYERIFVPEGYDRVLSSFSREEKNKISHRAKAIKKLCEHLKKK